MGIVKAISGHTGARGVMRYLERDGRALARDFLNIGAPIEGWEGVRVVGAQRRPGQLALPGELDHLAVLLDGERDLGVGAEVSLGRLRLAHEVVAVGQGVGRGLRGVFRQVNLSKLITYF
mgnify:CR=1 FL=1